MWHNIKGAQIGLDQYTKNGEIAFLHTKGDRVGIKMKKQPYFLSAYILFLFIYNAGAQISFDRIRNSDAIKSLLQSQSNNSFTTSSPKNPLNKKLSNTNIASVNEDEYIVDAGDQFIVKIDIKGPAYKYFEPIVTPDGFVVIPEGPTVKVKYLPLKRAKQKIKKALDASFTDSRNECYLGAIHPVTVNVIGSVPNNSKVELLSANRVNDAVAEALKPYLQDEKHLDQLKTISLRNVKIIRNQHSIACDLGKFLATGKAQTNPYLMDQDIVYLAYKDTLHTTIYVSGAVGKETEFEYKTGDDLQTALAFAGGLSSVADSSRIELVRLSDQGETFQSKMLSFPQDSLVRLYADDRIFVRAKADFHRKATVRISGAVKYPGDYAIVEGTTRLTEVVSRAGGFTGKASLGDARIERKQTGLTEDPELRRLGKVYMNEMDKIEKSYFRLRGRELPNLVSCDFEALFNDHSKAEDVLLENGDEIIIPEQLKTVYISGGVMNPGRVLYKKGMSYESYIEQAGGFTSRAKTSDIILIKGPSKAWLDADDTVPVEPGDTIFVPENAYWDWYEIFKDGLTITAQLISIFVLIRSIK